MARRRRGGRRRRPLAWGLGAALLAVPALALLGVGVLGLAAFALGNLSAYHGGADWSLGALARITVGLGGELLGGPAVGWTLVGCAAAGLALLIAPLVVTVHSAPRQRIRGLEVEDPDDVDDRDAPEEPPRKRA